MLWQLLLRLAACLVMLSVGVTAELQRVRALNLSRLRVHLSFAQCWKELFASKAHHLEFWHIVFGLLVGANSCALLCFLFFGDVKSKVKFRHTVQGYD